MHPAVGTLHRVIGKDYTLPNGAIAPKGTYVIVPAVAFHNDAELFPEPQKFDPDRFSDENKLKRHPFSYLPFGEGPRIWLVYVKVHRLLQNETACCKVNTLLGIFTFTFFSIALACDLGCCKQSSD